MVSLAPTRGTALGRESPCAPQQLALLNEGGARVRVCGLGLGGALDAPALLRSLDRLVERHEPLRTVLRTSEISGVSASGNWVQGVSDRPALAPLEADHSHLSSAEQGRALDSLAEQLRASCVVPAPLFRTALVRQGSQRWTCLLAANELVLDTFSFELLLQDLRVIYAAEIGDGLTQPADPGLQYADWLLWQAAVERAASGANPAQAGEPLGSIAPPETMSYTEREIGTEPAAALPEDRPGGRAEASAGRLAELLPGAIARYCARHAHPAPACMTSGRTRAEISSTVGPLAELRAFAGPLGDPVPAVRDGAFGAPFPTYSAPACPAVLWVESPLEVDGSFSPGIACAWTRLYDHAPSLSAAGSLLSLRALRDADQPGGGARLRLAFWSRRLAPEALERAADEVVANLDSIPPPTLDRGKAESVIPAAPAPAEVSSGTPLDATERTLAEIWAAVLQTPNVGRHENFFDLGGHSLLAVRIGTRIERAFHKEVPLNAILELPTIAEFAALLRPAVDAPGIPAVERSPNSLRSVSPGPIDTPALAAAILLPVADKRHRLVTLQEPAAGSVAQTPFFWIPGGRAISVLALREVSLQLGAARPVYGIESRLPQVGEGFLSVPERAEQYLELIRERQPHGPYLLAGFCMGGMVAFEVAQQLRRQGEEIGFLGLVQASTPGFPSTPALRRRMERQRRSYLLRTVAAFLALRLNPWRNRKPRDHQQAILDRVAKLVTGWVGTSSQLPEPTQQSNGDAMRAYRPAHYPGAVHIYLAQDCFESAGIAAELDPRRGWALISDSARICVMPGDHLSMLTLGPARSLAASIDEALPR